MDGSTNAPSRYALLGGCASVCTSIV